MNSEDYYDNLAQNFCGVAATEFERIDRGRSRPANARRGRCRMQPARVFGIIRGTHFEIELLYHFTLMAPVDG